MEKNLRPLVRQMSSWKLKFWFQEVYCLRHDRLEDELASADIAHEMLEAEKMQVLGAADDDVTVRQLLI